MLTTTQKIGMAACLILSCAVLAMVSFSADWDNIPYAHKEMILTAGLSLCVLLFFVAVAYCVWIIYVTNEYKSIAEMDDYNERMANQFNVGECLKPRENYIDRSDYLRFSRGNK